MSQGGKCLENRLDDLVGAFPKTTSNCKFYIDILVQQVCIICHRYILRYVEVAHYHHFYCKPVDRFKASKFDSEVNIDLSRPDQTPPDAVKRRFMMLLQNKKAPISSVVIVIPRPQNIRLSKHLNKSLHLMSYKNPPESSFHCGRWLKKQD